MPARAQLGCGPLTCGNAARNRVPIQGWVTISSVPSKASTRARSRASRAPPGVPVSVASSNDTSTTAFGPARCTATCARVASVCSPAIVSVSAIRK